MPKLMKIERGLGVFWCPFDETITVRVEKRTPNEVVLLDNCGKPVRYTAVDLRPGEYERPHPIPGRSPQWSREFIRFLL